jgi:beta-mannanase
MQHRPAGFHRAQPATPTPTEPPASSSTPTPRHRAETIVPAGPPTVPVRTLRMNPLLAAGVTIVLLGILAPAGIAGLSGASSNQADTKTLSFKAVADTFVTSLAPKADNGSALALVSGSVSGQTKITLVRFAVSGIPADATDVSARLVLRRDLHHLPTATVSASKILTSWSESVTWQNRPALGAKVAGVAVNRGMDTVTLNLGRSLASNGSAAVAITTSSTADVARFQSRETQQGPVLQVTYTLPSKTDPAPSPTSTTSSSSTTSHTSTSTSSSSTASSSSSTQASSGSCTLNAKLVPSCGMLWGVAPGAYTDQKRTDALLDFEKTVNQRMDIFHAYKRNDQLFPTADERAIASDPTHPRILFENWKPATDYTWAQVAGGAVDARIDRLAAYIKANYTAPFFLTVWHEPENDVDATPGSGKTAQDYHNMYRHVVLRLRADGVSNAITVANYQSYPAYSIQDWWPALYPGDDVVDWVAEDSYNAGTTSGYNSGDFEATVNKVKDSWNGFYNWARANHSDKPIMLAEWGIFQAGVAGRQAWYFNNVQQELPQLPGIKAMVYFDSPMTPLGATQFSQDPDALAAYKSLLRSTQPVTLP